MAENIMVRVFWRSDKPNDNLDGQDYANQIYFKSTVISTKEPLSVLDKVYLSTFYRVSFICKIKLICKIYKKKQRVHKVRITGFSKRKNCY